MRYETGVSTLTMATRSGWLVTSMTSGIPTGFGIAVGHKLADSLPPRGYDDHRSESIHGSTLLSHGATPLTGAASP